MPFAIKRLDGTYRQGTFESPCVPHSELPALLGLASMSNNRAVLDMVSNQLHFCGPGDVKLTLPPGTESYQLEVAPSGHLVLPIGDFEAADKAESDGSFKLDPSPSKALVLHLEQQAPGKYIEKLLPATSGSHSAEGRFSQPSSSMACDFQNHPERAHGLTTGSSSSSPLSSSDRDQRSAGDTPPVLRHTGSSSDGQGSSLRRYGQDAWYSTPPWSPGGSEDSRE